MLKGPEYSLKKCVFPSPAFNTSSPEHYQISTRKAGAWRGRESPATLVVAH